MGASVWRVGRTAEDRLMYLEDPSRQQRPETDKRTANNTWELFQKMLTKLSKLIRAH